ncbi:shikimate dehydrogenase [Herbiconiux sp. CPCC 203407]|uniref:Shikimate dehydrogenase n=1 Tax=Herbiconiux oxytropis TaxID=2970915 RepID=A0AA41XHR4_9MICO|nr:shikimate dehydrogenase [Herbiconiux oxytropis]MCS5720430.1 shikimate dehydrogenase [Herbiconiux oxytropis]MCS5726003.1 shikimate dehydrogenase [Herbiconiux oxytropis]
MTHLGSARRLAVLGSPIGHSRSPLLHRTAYAALGLPWEYEAVEMPADSLEGFVRGLDDSWRGLSLTMPLKETVLPLVDEVDAMARATGAVNTVLLEHDGNQRRLSGFNTDVHGITEAVRRGGISLATHAVIVGGGATARSAVVAAAQLGAEHVDIVLRTPSKAADVVESARAAGLTSAVVALDDPAVLSLAPDVTISTLPGGVGAHTRFEGAAAPGSSTLLDVAYHPWPSELASVWEAAGSPTIPGLAMLVHQAVAQVRIFVNGDPLVPLPDEEPLTAELLGAVDLP